MKKSLKPLINALRGVGQTLRGRNMQVICCAAAWAVIVAVAGESERMTLVLLTMVCAAVLAAECFNTAIERLGDAVTREHNRDIGAAKDMAAGAVLVLSIGAVAVAAVLFTDRAFIERFIETVAQNRWVLVPIVGLPVTAVVLLIARRKR